MNQKTKRRKKMNEEEIKRIIKEYLKENLRVQLVSDYYNKYKETYG